MYQTKVNNKYEFTINPKTHSADWDLIELRDNTFHLLKNNQSYTAEVVTVNTEEKTVVVKVNGSNYTVAIKDEMDLLLEKMGISNMASNKVNDIKAPMPGLVLDILVQVGDEIKKGDPILILEAMKMENVLKSPGDAAVKSVEVNKGDAVEKGQVLINFE